MLYWLFAATSQSMAALFAVVGMFAVFRYQLLDNRLRNLYDSLKNRFNTPDYIAYFKVHDSLCWEDSIIADRAEYLLKDKKGDLPDIIENNLELDIIVMRSHEQTRDLVLSRAKKPLISVLITFMLSVLYLPFTEYISSNISGVIVLIIIINMVTISILAIFLYLVESISPRPKRKRKEKKGKG